jgi:small subunit ribosomal protein S20
LSWRTRAKTHVKHAREAIATQDVEAASAAVQKAATELDRAASKGAIHHRNAARRKSRLMKQLAELEKSNE